MNKVIILDYPYLGDKELFEIEKQELEKNNIDLVLEDCKTEKDIISRAKDADVILCCGNPPMSRKVLSALPNCKVVIRYGIGVNSVDLNAATDLGKIVYNMPGYCAEELVIHASALILSLLRNINYYDSNIRKGNWPKAKGNLPRRLSNMIVGLYGFGASARPMARVFKDGFNSTVIASDPFINDDLFNKYEVEKVSFDELISVSDIISIHAPLNKDTYHIFNKEVFNKMKDSSMIINIARGPLINESDLIDALQSGQIKYAGLDVFENEPIDRDNPLTKMDNVVLTPHSAFYGKESLQNQHITAAKLVVDTLMHNQVSEENVANRAILSKKSIKMGVK